jgi:NDP-sugar pyrophosphorylase family protein
VFIPAAGLGERLRPITHHIPKPLLPVLGKPVLQYVLENISSLPFDRIGMNIYHKTEEMEEWIAKCPFNGKITLFPEMDMLGTGGALNNARKLLRDKPFLVHNSDILSDINLQMLIEYHMSEKNLVSLAVHDYPEFNCLVTDKHGTLGTIEDRQTLLSGDEQKMAFTGIAVYQPEFLNILPEGPSGVVDSWRKAIKSGYRIGTFDVSGCRWSDIGTPSSYAAAVFNAMKAEGETLFVHPSIKNCQDLTIQGYVVIENNCEVEKEAVLKNCILLPRDEKGESTTDINEVPNYQNCIAGPGFRIDLDLIRVLGLSGQDKRQLIGTGGSDRNFYRIKNANESVVLMQCKNDDPDFKQQIEYTRFFKKLSIPVPELLSVDNAKMQAQFEDAGDLSLYSYLKCPREDKKIESIYKNVIDVLVLIHTSVSEHLEECPMLKERIFNYEHFRWETNYFVERFVKTFTNIAISDNSKLENELHDLAIRADSFFKTVIHRDFQSQNIMIMRQKELRIIDYQGARIGPPAYDVASLLWDPYYSIDAGLREGLLEYYVSEIEKRGLFSIDTGTGETTFNRDQFRVSLIVCRLQRHMQALGAYGFLSTEKGKKYFSKYIPEGLRLLKEDILIVKDEYSELNKLIMMILSERLD